MRGYKRGTYDEKLGKFGLRIKVEKESDLVSICNDGTFCCGMDFEYRREAQLQWRCWG